MHTHPAEIPSWWLSLVAGAAAGIAVVAFLAIAWPWDLLVAPVLALWTALLGRLIGTSKRGYLSLFALTMLPTLVLVAVAGGLLAVISG